jgi:hypothetical protein
MNRSRALLVSTVVLLFALMSTVSLARYSSNAQETVTHNLFAGDPVLKEFVNYKQWTRVNDVPLPVSISLTTAVPVALGQTYV